MRRRNLLVEISSPLTLSTTSDTVTFFPGTTTFQVYFNGEMLTASSVSILSNQSWVTTEWIPSNSTAKLTRTENTSIDSNREAMITITYESYNAVFVLTQNYLETISSLPYDGTSNGYKYITIDGVKWAVNNVGASKDGAYGNYYKYGKGSDKYSYSQTNYSGTENPLASSADTATKVMGSNWHMPRSQDLYKLSYVTSKMVRYIGQDSNIKGRLFISGEKKLFIPFAGYYNWSSGSFYGSGSYTRIWGSSYNQSGGPYYGLINSGNMSVDIMDSTAGLGNGFSVRGVTK